MHKNEKFHLKKIYSCQWTRQVHKSCTLFPKYPTPHVKYSLQQEAMNLKKKKKTREKKRMEVGTMFQPKEDELSIFPVHLPVTEGVTCKTYDRQCRRRERAKYFEK